MTFGQRFARLATDVSVRAPGLWRLFRGAIVRNFDRLAPEWNATRVDATRMRTIETALRAVPSSPRRVLDVGTGTGAVARLASGLWPEAEVVGVDVSPGMVAEARRLASSDRERYEVADSAALPFADGAFDVVALNNMIPFFDELARVTAPGGHVAISYSLGAQTPIWVPLDRVRVQLERRGFGSIEEFSSGPGLSLLAHKAEGR